MLVTQQRKHQLQKVPKLKTNVSLQMVVAARTHPKALAVSQQLEKAGDQGLTARSAAPATFFIGDLL